MKSSDPSEGERNSTPGADDLPVPACVQPIERRSVGDRIKGQRTVRSDTQRIADAENLAVETAVHLPLHEAMQGKIHGDASGKQRNRDKRQTRPTAAARSGIAG